MRRRSGVLLSAASVAGAIIAMAVGARAVITRSFAIDTYDEMARGELERVTLSSRGELRVGRELRRIPIEGVALVWCAVQSSDGTTYVGTGNDGKIYRLRGNVAELYAETGTLVVTSLAFGDGGQLFAGTVPGGAIFKMSGGGTGRTGRADPTQTNAPVRPQRFAQLAGVEHVWALAYDARRHVLLAATGSGGKIYAIDGAGRAQEFYDSDEPHVLSLAIDSDGAVYAGTADHAVLLRIEAPGRARAIADFTGQEVKALALGRGGVLYAAVNEFDTPSLPILPSSTGAGGSPAGSTKALGGAAGPTGPTATTAALSGLPPPRPRPGKGSVFRVTRDGRTERLLRHDDAHFESLELGEMGAVPEAGAGAVRPASPVVYVGTATKGRILSVDDRRVVRTLVDVDERQVLTTLLASSSPLFGTGDAGAVYRLQADPPREASYLSRAFDTGHVSTWGVLDWRGTGSVSVQTRSGNTATPDGTWSPWSTPLAAPGPMSSPAARYLQFRMRWDRDPQAVVRAVLVYYLNQNQRAVVTEVQARNATPSGPSKEGSSGAVSDPPDHSAVFKITWKVDNPDNDPLRYRLFFRQEGVDARRPITRTEEVLTRSEYEWNTESVPEGNYLVEVEASDEAANPHPRVQRHAQSSAPLRVDNRPPEIAGIEVAFPRVRATDNLWQAHEMLTGYRYPALPVVDNGKLEGVITRADVHRVGRGVDDLKGRHYTSADIRSISLGDNQIV